MKLGIKKYTYDGGNTFYYITLNGRQIGPVYFSEQAVLDQIEAIKSGKKW